MKKLGFAVLIIGFLGGVSVMQPGCGHEEGPVRATTLRSGYKTMSEDEVKSMVNSSSFFDKRWNRYRSFPNNFELKIVEEHKVVIDHATGLVWHRSGSQFPLKYAEAALWIKDLNNKGYAGYNNWRLPTVEEAASLLERKRTNKRHIDPLFSSEQHSILTGDFYTEVRLWGVSYQYGSIFRVGINEPNYVRPVTNYASGGQGGAF
jgi:hypothetical protein